MQSASPTFCKAFYPIQRTARLLLGTLASALMALPGTVAGTSQDAWAEFGQTLESECRKQVAAGERKLTQVRVFPDKYTGVALLIGITRSGDKVVVACVYDKNQKTANLSISTRLEDLQVESLED